MKKFAAAAAAAATTKQRQIPVPNAPADVFDWRSRIGMDFATDVVSGPFSEEGQRVI